MALSKLDHGSIDAKEVNIDGLEALRSSLKYFQDGLSQFRVCHDLCLTGDLLDSEESRNLDQCAVDFRQISICVSSLAEKIASLWCKTCALFYKNFEKITGNPKKVLDNISQQADELRMGFEHIKERASKLADKFSSIQCYNVPVHQQFVKAFQDKSDTATKTESMMKQTHSILAADKMQKREEYLKIQQTLKATEESMKSKYSFSVPFTRQNLKNEQMLAILKQREQQLKQEFKTAEELEQITASNLQKAKAMVEECKSRESKAKVSESATAIDSCICYLYACTYVCT